MWRCASTGGFTVTLTACSSPRPGFAQCPRQFAGIRRANAAASPKGGQCDSHQPGLLSPKPPPTPMLAPSFPRGLRLGKQMFANLTNPARIRPWRTALRHTKTLPLLVKRFHMRKVVAIVLLVTVVLATFLVLLSWPAPAPVELMSVSAKSVGSVNGKNYKRVTAIIRNRSRVTFTGYISEIEVKMRGQWIDVDPGHGGGRMDAGKTIKQRFYVQEEAEACRLRLECYVDYQQPISPRQQALGKLGPWAVKLVWELPPLRKWFQDQVEPGEKKFTLEGEILPGASTSHHPSPSAPD